MLRHYDEFCAVLQLEPSNKFAELENHPFVATIKEKLALAEVSEDVFAAWKDEIWVGFFNHNLPALAVTQFPRHLGDTSSPFQRVMVDPRCFMDHMNSLAVHCNALHAQLCQQQNAIGNLTAMMQQMQFQMQVQTNLLQSLSQSGPMSGAAEFAPVTPSPTKAGPSFFETGSPAMEATTEESDQPLFVKRFTVSFALLPSKCTIADRFFFFFSELAKEGYERDLAMDLDPTFRKKLRNDFGRLKKTVKLMLLFCDNCPRERPRSPSELQDWLTELRNVSQQAESAMRMELYPDEPKKSMVQSALTAKEVSAQMKSWDDIESSSFRSLPIDTPEDTVKWFLGVDKSGAKRRAIDDLELAPTMTD